MIVEAVQAGAIAQLAKDLTQVEGDSKAHYYWQRYSIVRVEAAVPQGA